MSIVCECMCILSYYLSLSLSPPLSPDYKNGIQIYSSHDEKAIFQCCCDTNDDRRTLLHTLESTISEVCY